MSATGDRYQRGFTLIELLVILAIAGLIAGLAFPSVDRAVDRLQYRAAVSAVTSGLRDARARAIRSDASVAVAVTDGGRGLNVAGTPPVRVAAPVLLSGGLRAIIFFRDGSATGGAIDVRGRTDRARIAVEPATGRVRLVDARSS